MLALTSRLVITYYLNSFARITIRIPIYEIDASLFGFTVVCKLDAEFSVFGVIVDGFAFGNVQRVFGVAIIPPVPVTELPCLELKPFAQCSKLLWQITVLSFRIHLHWN